MKEPAEVQQDRTAIFFHPWQHCYFVVSGIASQQITNSQSDNRLQKSLITTLCSRYKNNMAQINKTQTCKEPVSSLAFHNFASHSRGQKI